MKKLTDIERVICSADTPGQRIRLARSIRNMSQTKLADAMSTMGFGTVTRTAMTQWENGKSRTPTAENILKIAHLLEVDAEILIFGKFLE